jgi:hypothetical protein
MLNFGVAIQSTSPLRRRSENMPRFALLLHRTVADYPRPTHYDLMLEAGDLCRTWALATEPPAGEAIAAEALPDHRKMYLEFEGEVSAGRGLVTRIDAGDFQWLSHEPCQVRVAVQGDRLRGSLELTQSDPESPAWQCRYLPRA